VEALIYFKNCIPVYRGISISKNYSVSSLFSLIDGNRGIRHMDLSLFDVSAQNEVRSVATRYNLMPLSM
jgi:hypothetical protein